MWKKDSVAKLLLDQVVHAYINLPIGKTEKEKVLVQQVELDLQDIISRIKKYNDGTKR